MSRKLDSLVQTQMAVAVFKSPLRGEYPRNNRMEGKQPVGRRRVFVQTETGCVLGMELDRSDSAHTVKRRLQVALNFPAEQSSLTFGDVELKNDLSAVRNDSPLLLTRNYLHRSSSTPCLSPTGKDLQQRDKSGPIEILGHSDSFNVLKVVVKDIVKAIKMGVDPLPVHSGLGGAYYFRNPIGENVAIVKPTDEEPFAPNNPKGFVGKALGQPGLKRSVRVGETGFREVVAYLLDHDHFANVPPTALVKITHSVFNVNDGVNRNRPHKNLVSKIASCQQFIRHDFDASDHGTSSFPVSSVHRIGILDIRIFNTDRHAGNLLVRKLDGIGRFGQMELIPIDHGLCLPETLEDPYFEWIHWPQASIPFSEDELEYIQKLDPMKDCEMLRRELPMIREACLRILVLCTIFLKEAAAFGLCLAEIGEMVSREFRAGEEEPSELEVICLEARRLIAERELSSPKSDVRDAEFQFDIDFEEPELDLNPKMASSLLILATIFVLCSFGKATHPGLILTVVNNCPFTIYPAIQPNAGHPVLERGGFALHTLTHRSFPAPTVHWSGRIWARTGCTYSNGHFSCATGDCGHRIECNGLGGATPVTIAQFSLHHGGHRDLSSYEVSLVDGFNIPMTVTPHEGKGLCPVVGCRANILATCPGKLQYRSPPHGPVVGCKSGCAAFGTDELCCRNHYNSPQTCRASSYSEFFKHACPATFTYAHDSPSLMHDCSSPRELKVIFCH